MTKPFQYPTTESPQSFPTNPYEFPPGPELDALIHELLLSPEPTPNFPPYSTDSSAIDKVKKRLQAALGISIITGKTRFRRKPWFARYQTDASDGTEVLAETYSLAICRLALLKKQKG